MFAYVSENITNRLLRKNVIEYDDYEIYQFGLEQLLTTILNVITTAILGIIFGQLWQSLLFVTAFMVLRSYAGGYHASTPIKCYLLTALAITSVLSVTKYIEINSFVCMGLLAISGGIIFVLSPIGTKSKPIDNMEYVIYRKKTIIIWCMQILVAVICMLIGLGDLSTYIMMAHIVLSVAQIFGMVEMKITENEAN